MAVVIQRMLVSKKSGVSSLSIRCTSRKDRIVAEAAFGLGENVVNGEHTPDHYSPDRKGTIKRSQLLPSRSSTNRRRGN